MTPIYSDVHDTHNFILQIVIGSYVNTSFGCLYPANTVYIAHFDMLISLIHIHMIRKRNQKRK